ncbi:MAG: hypothetical protein ACYTEL_22240 [Planctomycetota bacterium]
MAFDCSSGICGIKAPFGAQAGALAGKKLVRAAIDIRGEILYKF